MRPTEAVRVPLPTPFGVFEVRAFEQPGGDLYVAMIYGDIGDGDQVLVRLHSECLTGDALGSLRCDCGVQLRLSLRLIAAAGRGVVVYVTGHEGRGIGLVNKLRAYVAQDDGADTVDANVLLGFPVDSRDYTDAAAVLAELGVRTVRLLTNNPRKATGLTAAGAVITDVVPLTTAPHHRNAGYLATKARRMGHVQPTGVALSEAEPAAVETDVTTLIGRVRPQQDRPYVVLKYAQTMDGRIATSTGDARWISGTAERTVSHALRAAADGVLVGVGTALQDDPELTVRMVAGASPVRIVLDSTLRTPTSAKVLSGEAATTLITTARSDPERRAELCRRGVRVEVVAEDGGLVSLPAALAAMRVAGIECLLVEGGASIITSLLAAGLVDRLIVAVSPLIVGAGTEAVRGLGVEQVADGIRLANRLIVPVGEDVILAWDVLRRSESSPVLSAATPVTRSAPKQAVRN
jgi:3,4-dihydroxy 2-butanone 4-phosphate synthase/GTP cyclohydrolase II